MLNPQILLAMDDVSEGQKISHWLNSCGFQAVIFNIWDKEASFRFENIKPDIIFMDIFYKGHSNAMNFIEKIKGDLDIPLVYLTSDFFDYHDELPITNNNFKFLVSPIDPKLLRFTMEMALYTHSMKNSLQNSEQNYRLLIENARDLIVLASYSGNLLQVNKSAAKFFGLKRDDFPGKSIWDIFPNKYANKHIKNIRGVIESGKGRLLKKKLLYREKNFGLALISSQCL